MEATVAMVRPRRGPSALSMLVMVATLTTTLVVGAWSSEASAGPSTPAAGAFRYFPGTNIWLPGVIVSGPDGALWFTDSGYDTVSRITTHANTCVGHLS
jgi:streptogramin lyase